MTCNLLVRFSNIFHSKLTYTKSGTTNKPWRLTCQDFTWSLNSECSLSLSLSLSKLFSFSRCIFKAYSDGKRSYLYWLILPSVQWLILKEFIRYLSYQESPPLFGERLSRLMGMEHYSDWSFNNFKPFFMAL